MNTAFCLHQFILKLCLWCEGGRKVRLKQQRKSKGDQEEMLVYGFFPSRSLLPLERVSLPETCNKMVQGGENWETNLFSLRVKQDYLS